MAEVTPQQAATIILSRDVATESSGGIEVLMLRRHEGASFVPDVWVFPGGATDAQDAEAAPATDDDLTLRTMRVTAVRELFEETGLWMGESLPDSERHRLDLLEGRTTIGELLGLAPVVWEELAWISRWITPREIPRRFDTWFFAAAAPQGVPTLVTEEAVELRWVTPADALDCLKMVFPTIRNLESIRAFRSSAQFLRAFANADVQAVEPRVVNGKIVLP